MHAWFAWPVDHARSVKHPHILEFIGSEVRANRLCIFTEYVGGGSMRSRIRKFGAFDESLAARYLRQLLLSLEYLHARGIVHCDVKCANILLDDHGGSKLADFGDALHVSADGWVHEHGHLHGTPRYLAPEAITSEHNGPPRDVWAAGCTLIYMLTGQPAWRHKPIRSVEQLVAFIDHTRETPVTADIAAGLSAEAADFLRLTFIRDPLRRPSATQLLSHPFVARSHRLSGAVASGSVPSMAGESISPPADETRAPARSPAVLAKGMFGQDRVVGTDGTPRSGELLVQPAPGEPLERHCSGSSKSSTDSGRGGFPCSNTSARPPVSRPQQLVIPRDRSRDATKRWVAAEIECAVVVGGVVGATPPGQPSPYPTKAAFGSAMSGLSATSSVAASTATVSVDRSSDAGVSAVDGFALARASPASAASTAFARSHSGGAPRIQSLGRTAATGQRPTAVARCASGPCGQPSLTQASTPLRARPAARRSGGDGRPWSDPAETRPDVQLCGTPKRHSV